MAKTWSLTYYFSRSIGFEWQMALVMSTVWPLICQHRHLAERRMHMAWACVPGPVAACRRRGDD